MLQKFIERPVLSSVVSILIVVLGVIGINSLPIEQYPDIAPPTIRVTTAYNGADAEAVLNSVIVPLEEQINGVENMTYIESSASNGGGAAIKVYFKQGSDADMAAVNVQNKVAQATPLLPAEVVRNGVRVQKVQSSVILMINLISDNNDYDDKFIQNYANINILPELKRIQGVGDASVFGPKTYAMRVWLKPDAMKTYSINPNEVIAALQDQNIESAPGEIGANSEQAFQYPLKFTGRLKSTEEFENVIIRSTEANTLRLKDVAKVELGVESYAAFTENNGRPSVLIGISQTAGSNAQEIIETVKKAMTEAEKSFPPGLRYSYQSDASEFLNASISKVIKTLIEAFILVFLVVLLFLQNFKSTLIPAIAVPVSIIGTFFFLLVFGFSINLLTLFALILAIGIVVDDAIVVVEAVHAKLEAGEKDVKKAAANAISEIAPAIISITLVMSAVFIPVGFIGGTSGVFYKQFGVTLAAAIILSAVNALTLSPMLCAIFLKPHEDSELKNKNLIRKFLYYFNVGFNAVTEKYRKALGFLTRKNNRWISLGVITVFALVFWLLGNKLPTGFVPQEDSGRVMGNITLAPGSSLETTDSLTRQVVEMARELPHVESVTSMTGLNFTNGRGTSYGAFLLKMDPWEERSLTANDLSAMLKAKTDSITNADFMIFGMPTLQGFGVANGVELQMIDRTGGDVNKFYEVTNEFLAQLRQRPEVTLAMTSFDPRYPQKLVEANIPRIKDAGLTLNQVMGTLQTYVGSVYVSNFNTYGKQFRVYVQSDPFSRSSLADLHGLTIKTANGIMVPITEFIDVKDITAPQTLTRFNLFSSMDVTIIPNYKQGYTSGDVLKLVKDIPLPEGYGFDYSGMTREEAGSTSQTALIFALSLIFVYFLLAALYESYIIPFAVLLSLPVGLAGVYIFIYFSMLSGGGISNNIYVQIALIMLIGLLAKNAILIVEYAIQRREKGMSIVKAAIEGAVARLRPILMTSFAFIFGLLPLAMSQGAGAIGNRSIGISATGGMLIGTLIGVVVIPTLFVLFQTLQEKISPTKSQKNNESEIKELTK